MLTAATSPNLPSQYNPDLDMIQCTCCEDFFHAACIGATNEELPYLSNLGFVCMEVRRRMASFQHAPLQVSPPEALNRPLCTINKMRTPADRSVPWQRRLPAPCRARTGSERGGMDLCGDDDGNMIADSPCI